MGCMVYTLPACYPETVAELSQVRDRSDPTGASPVSGEPSAAFSTSRRGGHRRRRPGRRSRRTRRRLGRTVTAGPAPHRPQRLRASHRDTHPDASATTLRTRRTRPSRPPPRPSRPTPSKPHLNNLPPRTLRGGRHGADDDHDGRTDGRTGPARTRPGLAGCKEPGCKEPCQPLGRVGRRLASPRSRPKLVRPARPMRLGWARFIPSGARPGQEMVPWEDRSAPHSTAPPSEPRNHAEAVERIRGAGPNDPPGAPFPASDGLTERETRAQWDE